MDFANNGFNKWTVHQHYHFIQECSSGRTIFYCVRTKYIPLLFHRYDGDYYSNQATYRIVFVIFVMIKKNSLSWFNKWKTVVLFKVSFHVQRQCRPNTVLGNYKWYSPIYILAPSIPFTWAIICCFVCILRYD